MRNTTPVGRPVRGSNTVHTARVKGPHGKRRTTRRNKVYPYMKHIRQISKRPATAQLTIGALFTVFSQVLQVVGTMLIQKDELNLDPYDY